MMIGSEVTKLLSEVEQLCSGKSDLEALDIIQNMEGMRHLLGKLSSGMPSRDKQPYKLPSDPKAGEALKMADEIEIAIRANDCQGALRVAEQLRVLSKEQHWL